MRLRCSARMQAQILEVDAVTFSIQAPYRLYEEGILHPGAAGPTTYTAQPMKDGKDVTAHNIDSQGSTVTIWDLVPKGTGKKGQIAELESRVTVTLRHAEIIDEQHRSHGSTIKGWTNVKASKNTAWLKRA